MPHTIVPDYIIYDELKRQRQRRRRESDIRPQLDAPCYLPYVSEDSEIEEKKDQNTHEDRGEVVIRMW